MRCEFHHGRNSLNNVANLHVTMAVPNCEFYEFFPCTGANLYGLISDIEVDAAGMVHAPAEPGLGYRIDWDLVKRNLTLRRRLAAVTAWMMELEEDVETAKPVLLGLQSGPGSCGSR